MSQWVDRISGHSVFSALESLQNALEQAKPRADETSTDAVEALDRVSRVSQHLSGLLRRVDPLLIIPAWLDNLRNCLSQANSHVDQFRADGNVDQLTSANGQMDNALVHSAPLHALATPADVEDLREAISTFRRACGQLTRHLESEVDQTQTAASTLKSKLDELTTEVTSQKQRLDVAITSFTQSFNDAETARSRDFSELKEKSHADFEEHLETWRDKAKTLRDENQEAFDALISNADDAHKSSLAGSEKKCADLLSEIGTHRSEAERLVGIISMTGMVGGYQRVANIERSAFVRWRIGTVVSMVLLSGFAIYTFFAAVSPEFQPGMFANRLFVTVTLAILAGYSAFQADRHRRAEIENRRMELELASFDPFLASLTDEERNELKKAVADRLFGRNLISGDDKEGVSPKNILELLKLTLDNLSKAKV